MTTWSEQLKAEGHAEGRTEGMIGMLVSMAQHRFGEAAASTIAALLGSVTSEAALSEIGSHLLTCESSDDLIAGIRQILVGFASPDHCGGRPGEPVRDRAVILAR